MNRATTVLICLVSGTALSAPARTTASDARVEALTIPGFYIDDQQGRLAFPTVIARVSNMVEAGLGTSGTTENDNHFGVIASGNRDGYGVFQIYMRGANPFLESLSSTFGDAAGPNINIPSQQFDIGWAKQFGSTAFGARFEHARSSLTVGDDESSPILNPGQNNWNTSALHLGVKFDTGERNFLELGGELRNLSYKNSFGGDELTDDAGLSYRASARYWSKLNDKTDFVPAVSLSKVDATQSGAQDNRTYSSIHAGAAFLFDVNQDNLLSLGAAFNYRKDDASDVSSTLFPTLFGSLEWDLKSWLTGRVGAQQAMRMTSLGSDTDRLDSEFSYGLGLGFHFNNFDLDTVLNERLPFSSGYLVSGDSTSDPFLRVTGVYRF
ncbi:MAG: hypothetical protein SGI90_01780 [Candidatus Eisenbacteria bacterium]|nr:hypothetical protein [Candidatus Eisenbacteria bacterium]